MDGTLAPAASPRVPEPSYRVSGDGRELFTRAQIRTRIRNGDITSQTELAPEDSDDYRPAGTFPELARYFSLAADVPPARTPVAAQAATTRRIMAGVVYPFTGIGWIILVAAAILQSVPFGSVIAAVFTVAYVLALIRSSSEGSTTMPAPGAVGPPGQFLLSVLKGIAVVIGSCWPLLLATLPMLVLQSPWIPLVAGFVVTLYLPAAMAALAKWNSLVLALSPSSMFRMMSLLGNDYIIAIAALYVSIGIARGGAIAIAFVLRRSPLAVEAVATFLTMWAMFYTYHLIGWAMYRRRDLL